MRLAIFASTILYCLTWKPELNLDKSLGEYILIVLILLALLDGIETIRRCFK